MGKFFVVPELKLPRNERSRAVQNDKKLALERLNLLNMTFLQFLIKPNIVSSDNTIN